MKLFKYIFLALFLIITTKTNAQLGLGTKSPNPAAALDITSDQKGVLIPRLNLGDRRLIKLPAIGLLIYNTTNKCIEVNRGTKLDPVWKSVTGEQGSSGISYGTGVSGPSGVIQLDSITGLPINLANSATGLNSAVGGGVNNHITGSFTVIAGGTTNFATGDHATISGGSTNDASGNMSSIGGGTTNNTSGIGASISGGTTNNAAGDNSSIGGGTSNNAGGDNAHIGGGSSNMASGTNASSGGGVSNLASGAASSISGGTSNIASAANSTVSGGTSNQAIGVGSSVSGGTSNIALGVSSTIGGGTSNIADGISTAVGGGTDNRAYEFASTISGGTSNRTNYTLSSIGGGTSNNTKSNNSTISGGFSNFSNSYGEWVGGLNSPAYVPTSKTDFAALDRIFNVGCGANFEVLTILKNGLAKLPNVTLVDIATHPKAITTKDFTDATYSRISTLAPTSSTALGFLGEIRVTPEYTYTCIAANSWVRTLMTSWEKRVN